MNIRETILLNIRAEIRNLLRNQTPISLRDPKWDADIVIIMAEEKKIFEREQIEAIEQSYRTYHEKHTSGITFEEWMDKVKQLYKVVDSVVISISRGPDHEKTWEESSHYMAHKRVLKLIAYKRYDHFIRGHDFAYDPDKST